MNRRSFIQRTIGAFAAAYLAPILPARVVQSKGFQYLTYRGVPIVYDQHCPRHAVYFINPETLWINKGDGWKRPF